MRYLLIVILALTVLVPFRTIAEDASSKVVTGNQASQSTADELEQRGKQLHDELTQKIKEWKPPNSFARLNVTSTILKYIPVHSSFKNAHTILKEAGFDVGPMPPRPPRSDDPNYERFNISGGFKVFIPFGNEDCAIRIIPDHAGDPDTTVGEVSAAVFINLP